MELFFAENITSVSFVLNEEESNHIIRVLRMKSGDTVSFTDGKGFFYQCRIIDANPKKCRLEVLEKNEDTERRNYSLHIAIAPTKNINRFEWFLEKATEIGIDSITPIICQHSERREIKTDRLKKVITAAMKQSVKSFHPLLNPAMPVAEFIAKNQTGLKYIAYISPDVKQLLKDTYLPGNNAILLIGPEGDFSNQEVELATKNGFLPVSLGKSRLRTETAGIAACHTINLLNC